MKLKHSLVYSSSSGPIHGGLVSSGANGSTLCIRTRKRVGMSNKQSKRRVTFLEIAQAWSTLSPIAKRKYCNAALLVYRKNHFTGQRAFTGFQLFFYFNFVRSLFNATVLTNFEFRGNPFNFVPLSFVFNPAPASLLFNFISPNDNLQRLLIFASVPLPVSAKITSKSYKYLGTSSGTSVSPINYYSAYRSSISAVFPSGYCIYFRLVSYYRYGQPCYPDQFLTCLIP